MASIIHNYVLKAGGQINDILSYSQNPPSTELYTELHVCWYEGFTE